MESSKPVRVLVVARRTAATAGLGDAIRRRAAEGPATFALLVPRTAHGHQHLVGLLRCQHCAVTSLTVRF